MERKAYLAISMSIWLIGAGLVGLTAKGLPDHVVAGGVMGPGGDVSSGTSNPANAVGMVFYSTTQPLYTMIFGPDSFTAADNTDPALFASDVGNIWDWLDGDEMVSVFETTLNVNGWTGANYTTSLTAALALGAPVQDVGNVTLEPFPAITLARGADWVNATWSPLADAGNNVQSYGLYRAPTPAGPFVSVATVLDGVGLRSYNNTGLTTGPVCYQFSVNYRRDTVGGLYETTARSSMVCTVVGTPPTVVSKTPASNAINVPVANPIIVTFSETMNTGTVTVTLTPSLTLTPAWSVGDTVLTLTHATAFTVCQSYRVDVTGRDMDSLDLVPSPTTWTFSALCDQPFLVSTSPANGATQVRSTADIVITFSEAMNIATVTNSTTPSIALVSAWSAGNTVLTLSHATPFIGITSYQVTIAGQDLDGNILITGAAPNPWTFTANTPPTVTVDPSDTLIGYCCSGGSGLPIPWIMNDVETPIAQLVVWLNYTLDATTGTIAGPLTGRSASDSYTWTTPSANGNLTVYITVIDGAQEPAQDSSAQVTMDSIAPFVLTVVPADASNNVVIDTQVVVTFSEPMQRSTVEIIFAPAVASLQHTWNAASTVVTVSHDDFAPSTAYTLTVNATARDNCTPGIQMGAADTTTFTTGTGVKAPNPPINLAVSSQAYNAITLTWTAPTHYTDGSLLPGSQIASYKVYRATSSTGAKTAIGTPTTTTFTDNSVEQEKTYYYWVTAVNTTSMESDFSNMVSVTVPKQSSGGLDIMTIAIILIVILLVVGLLLVLMRRKKPEEAPAAPPEEEAPSAPEEEKEEAPQAEAPSEEPSKEAPQEPSSEGTPKEEPGK